MDRDNEIFPLVDEEGRPVGKATRKYCHSGSMALHPVVHLHVFDPAGDLYLQKRSENKDIQAGKWDTSVGGHIDYGEEVLPALEREAREELGLTGFRPEFLWKYIYQSKRERELVYAFRTVYTGRFKIDHDEVTDGKFWKIEEIKKNLDKNVFTPNFEKEFGILMKNE